ncbi:MAG: type VI secretion system protein TssA [Burkholderiaceae bacterium]|nr:type VI secretion system protein TssA [Burkholderiaceae bacterium]
MSDLEHAETRVAAWLQALADEQAPCGPDLEYDNEFLALTQAAAGKPESQFGAAEPPDWPAVLEGAEGLLERSRDLRIAIYWLRAGLRMHGIRFLPTGLRLLIGMTQGMWDHVHPLPDPDDGDPYGRVNALTLLREPAAVLGDLRAARVVQDRAIGDIDVRAVELASSLGQPIGEETVLGMDSLRRMIAAAVERTPEIRTAARESVALLQEFAALLNQRLGMDAPDLKPVLVLLKALVAVMPADAVDGEAADIQADAGDGAPSTRRSLTGVVTSRDDALRAIDMVCEYLERAEPTNPAPLFLRRARQLVNHSFLQLMKELAPDALSDVARIVGVDPDSVEIPTGG